MIVPLVALISGCNDGSETVRRQLAQELGSGTSTVASTGSGSTASGTVSTGSGGGRSGTGDTTGASGTGGTTGVGGAGGTGQTTTGGGSTVTGDDSGVPREASTPDPYSGPFKVLVLSKALEYVHASIPDCQQMLRELGATTDANLPPGSKPGSQFTIDIANLDLSDFTDAKLAGYGAVFSCNPQGTVFSTGGANGKIGMAAIQKWVEGGGALDGVHSASDFEKTNGWPWLTNDLMGGYFALHDDCCPPGIMQVQAPFADHPVVRGIPATWNCAEEWYVMNRDIEQQPGFKVLMKATAQGSANHPEPRPSVWTKEFGTNGRMFYTIRGHDTSAYKEPIFRKLIHQGVLWSTHRMN
jgi:type 1 glutamine amidotransferase